LASDNEVGVKRKVRSDFSQLIQRDYNRDISSLDWQSVLDGELDMWDFPTSAAGRRTTNHPKYESQNPTVPPVEFNQTESLLEVE